MRLAIHSREVREYNFEMVFKDTSALRDELRARVRAGRYLLIGTTAVHQYLQRGEPKDEDYLVDEKTYRAVRRWAKSKRVVDRETRDGVSALGVDIVRSAADPVLNRIFRSESIPRRAVLPSAEALAAMKLLAFTSRSRPAGKRRRDVIDYLSLVKLRGFRRLTYLSFFRAASVDLRAKAGDLHRAGVEDRLADFLPYMA